MRKYFFNRSWWSCLGLYFSLFILIFIVASPTLDEYEGGDKVADFARALFDYIFLFPLIFEGMTRSPFLKMICAVGWLYNPLLVPALMNFVYMKIRRKSLAFSNKVSGSSEVNA